MLFSQPARAPHQASPPINKTLSTFFASWLQDPSLYSNQAQLWQGYISMLLILLMVGVTNSLSKVSTMDSDSLYSFNATP